MKKFNPENKDILTYGECLGPAMEITDQGEADQYFSDYLAWQVNHMSEASGEYTPEQICKQNLGYYAGYYSDETRERVERLFRCQHSVFGKITNGAPTAEQAFELGRKASDNT